jgi:hypothetical protein
MNNAATLTVAVVMSGLAAASAAAEDASAAQGGLGELAAALPGLTLSNTEYAVTARGPHERKWVRTVWQLTARGKPQARQESYVELGTGLCYLNDNGEWVDSQELVEGVAGGAAARRGQIRVFWANDLATSGAIDMQLPDGQRLRSNPIGIGYFDGTNSVLLATVKSCQGKIAGTNTVIYENAFEGISASVRYTYTLSGMEQDIIIPDGGASLPAPESFGMSAVSARLEVLSEFLDSVTPVNAGPDGATVPDTDIDFATLRFVRGRAFTVETGGGGGGIDVSRQWLVIRGRRLLLEDCTLEAVRRVAPAPQKTDGASAEPANGAVRRVASAGRLLPSPLREGGGQVGQMKVAQVEVPAGALVLDYVTVNSSQTNYVFQQTSTYYISANVSLYGTNTAFEPGTVLKYNNNVTLTVNTPITWLGRAYRPVILTSKADTTVGAYVAAGPPGSSYYATTALYFDATTANTNLVLQHLRVLNAKTAVAINGQAGHVLSHVQAETCGNGLALTNADVSLRNALMDQVMTNFTGSSSTCRVEHLTVDTANYLNRDIGTNLFLTNSLVVYATNAGSYSQQYSVFTNATGIFTNAGAGYHYLVNGSPYRAAGTNGINPALAADLKRTSTYPPLLIQNYTFPIATNLAVRATRNGGTPDLGYAYPGLDYLILGINIQVPVTLGTGVALGIYHNWGFCIYSTGSLTGGGRADQMNEIASYMNVQERPDNYSYWSDCLAYSVSDADPLVDLWFTEFSYGQGMTAWLASSITAIGYYYPANRFSLRNCQVRGGAIAAHAGDCMPVEGEDGIAYSAAVCLTNNLFERGALYLTEGTPYGSCGGVLALNVFNNLFWNGTVSFTRYYHDGNLRWDLEDNLFDKTVLSKTTDGFVDGYVLEQYNGFTTGTTSPFSGGANNNGANDKTSLTGDYQVGPLSRYYYPTNGLSGSLTNLIDAGSRLAAAAGLYHYTTTANQVKEGTTQVDIGWHVVALDANGNPDDYDADGIPDYLADTNGDGLYGLGDLGNWMDFYNSTNNLAPGRGLKVFTPLK